ncbi:hypothetical protein NXG27_01135 [Megasphaera paucivorans]|uniref:Uncharacterized protein n=1 Tax=Megasphaera paucivorans TaxID=349095 RepID=A0A1G9QG12_9FIRM|nr:hypothetical protein [Megasphaera paucivorans]SDM09992.1 hypothetical protein SAMN05660299_00228 [Megasphaera paucivorans]
MLEEVNAVQTIDAAIPEATVQDTPATNTTVEQDLATVRAKKDELIAAGETLFKDEIASLEEKEKSLTAQIETEAKETETQIVTAETSFREKYGNIMVNGIEIIGIGAIIYRLFFF